MVDKDKRIYKMLADDLRKAMTEEDLKNLSEEMRVWFENSDRTDPIPQIDLNRKKIKSDCDKCIHADSVSGYEDGQDMFVCGIEDSLTDEDVECANKNECPYYIPNDDE